MYEEDNGRGTRRGTGRGPVAEPLRVGEACWGLGLTFLLVSNILSVETVAIEEIEKRN